MTTDAGTWCPCGQHRTDPRNGRPTCPICVDRTRQDAAARIHAMGWRQFGTGGEA